jgi:hypothetical protein
MLVYQRVSLNSISIQSPVAQARRPRRMRFRLKLHANQVLGQALREVRHEELALCFAVEDRADSGGRGCCGKKVSLWPYGKPM